MHIPFTSVPIQFMSVFKGLFCGVCDVVKVDWVGSEEEVVDKLEEIEEEDEVCVLMTVIDGV